MQKTKRLNALLLAVCVLLSTAICAGVARAEGSYTLKVSVAEDLYADDAAAPEAAMSVKLYKVADATKDPSYDTYSYTLVAPYAELQARFDALQAGTSEETWQDLYDAAAELEPGDAAGGGSANVGEEAKVTVSDPGIYLVLVSGDGADDNADLYTATYGYKFQPTMVALPGKDAVDGVSGTAVDFGEWKDEIAIVLKASRSPLFGSLTINKSVDFSGEDATFVFRVQGEGYDNYAAITMPAASSTTLTHIPAGIEVTVTEVYTGARYTAGAGDGSTATIVADKAVELGGTQASVEITNTPNGNNTPGGHGIENHFEWSDEAAGGAGDWTHTATPAQTTPQQ